MMKVIEGKGFGVTLANGKHEIISDISQELGGEGKGLDPHELIEGALGACTTLTLKLYAKRKNWDISGIQVEVKILQEGPETLIDRKITFGEQNSPEERKRLIEIANKCPIHRLLESRIQIETHE